MLGGRKRLWVLVATAFATLRNKQFPSTLRPGAPTARVEEEDSLDADDVLAAARAPARERHTRGPVWRVDGRGYTLALATEGEDPAQEACVEVCFPDGRSLSARLHTPESVRAILDRWHRKDERSGLYFWAPDVIVVREITRESVVALVEDLIAEGELEMAFSPVSNSPEAP